MLTHSRRCPGHVWQGISRLLPLRRGLSTALFASHAVAQAPPAPRPLLRVTDVSTEPMRSVSQVRALGTGRVIVNDNAGRRVLMFDASLRMVAVIADSDGSSGTLYASRLGGIVAYRGDSTLFVDPTAMAMLVIDPNGRVVRTMAIPRADAANALIGGPFGTPGFDNAGRLVYRAAIRPTAGVPASGAAPQPPDSSLIVRFDFATRAVDTVARFAIPQIKFDFVTIELGGREVTGSVTVVNPIPWTDDWAVLTDGTIAIVRGREYRVDLVTPDGNRRAGPRLPFLWQKLTDEDKAALIDSTRNAMLDGTAARMGAAAQRQSTGGIGSGRGVGPPPTIPLEFVPISEMPDYRPAFRQGAARGDADGNLWIRTTQMTDGGAVYDVVNSRGTLIERFKLPPGRTIAGFGPGGIVYMGVLDGVIARLERAVAR